MRPSPRFALACLLAAAPLTAQENLTVKATRTACVAGAARPGKAESQVACDIKLIRVSDAMLEILRFQSVESPASLIKVLHGQAAGLVQVGFDADAKGPPDPKRRVQYVSPADLQTLLDAFQASPATHVLSSPKIVVVAGEPADVSVGEIQTFNTGLTVVPVDGQTVFIPTQEKVEVGSKIRLTAAPAADGKTITVAVDARVTELGDPAGKATLTTMIDPVTAEGRRLTPVPFTQHMERPTVLTRGVNETLAIPVGCSAILYAGADKRPHTVDVTPKAPAKTKLFSRVFHESGKGKTETDHLLVILTPTVIGDSKTPAHDVKACAASAPVKLLDNSQLALLQKAYRDACAAGKTDDARRLAIECLAIDPTCFGTK